MENQLLTFAQDAAAANSIWPAILMIGGMFVVFYFITLRPQQKQQKKHQELVTNLKKGDEVALTSGIVGKIFSVDDRFISLEIGDKTRMKVLKQAVSGKLNQDNTSK